MDDATQNLFINIEAQDRASKVLDKIEENIKALSNEAQKGDKYVSKYANSINGLQKFIASKKADIASKRAQADIEAAKPIDQRAKNWGQLRASATRIERGSLKKAEEELQTALQKDAEAKAAYMASIAAEAKNQKKIYDEVKGSILKGLTATESGIRFTTTENIETALGNVIRERTYNVSKSGLFLGDVKEKQAPEKTEAQKQREAERLKKQKDKKAEQDEKARNQRSIKNQKAVFGLLGDVVKKNPLTNFLKSTTRIATYRLIRTLIKSITSAFSEGLKLVAQGNEELTNSFIQLKQTGTAVKTLFGSIASSLLTSFTPALSGLTEQLIGFTNGFSAVMAQQRGDSKYWSISADKVREYAESLREATGQLTELDKFATLSKGQPQLGEWVEIDSEEAKSTISEYEDAVQELVDFIALAGTWISNTITKITDKIKDGTIGDTLKNIASGLAIVVAVTNPALALLGSFAVLLSDASPQIKTFASLIMGLATAFLAFGVAKAFVATPLAALAVAGIAGAIAASFGISLSGNYAGAIGQTLGLNRSYVTNEVTDIPLTAIGSREVIGAVGSSGNVTTFADDVSSIARNTAESATNTTNYVGTKVELDGKAVGTAIAYQVYQTNVKAGRV